MKLIRCNGQMWSTSPAEYWLTDENISRIIGCEQMNYIRTGRQAQCGGGGEILEEGPAERRIFQLVPKIPEDDNERDFYRIMVESEGEKHRRRAYYCSDDGYDEFDIDAGQLATLFQAALYIQVLFPLEELMRRNLVLEMKTVAFFLEERRFVPIGELVGITAEDLSQRVIKEKDNYQSVIKELRKHALLFEPYFPEFCKGLWNAGVLH